MIELHGIAWNHTRGFLPVVATAQRFEERHPDVRITWEKRSLQAFADASMEALAREYDLIIMDHPHTALSARAGLLLPLEPLLDTAFLADQATHSVGQSHQSYTFDGQQWTLATDAAAPIATWRPDLIAQHGLSLPQSWEDLLALAEDGFVTACLYPIDSLMHLLMFCDALGHPAFASDAELAPDDILSEALGRLLDLAARVDPACFHRNPIHTAEYMSTSNEPAATYCPFAYGYSNYSRPGYARFSLQAGPLVSFRGRPLRSVLGGAGMAISSHSRHPETAAAYAVFTAAPETQSGIYFNAGGQPGHRTAWTSPTVNAQCDNFFLITLSTLDRALMRPKYPGYMQFQDLATPVVHDCLTGECDRPSTVSALQSLYRQSLLV
jgi:multiple sugar transport system substrate-binding protein